MPLDVAKIQKAIQVGVKTLTSAAHIPALALGAGALATGGNGPAVLASSMAVTSLMAVGGVDVWSQYSDPPPKW